MQRFGRQRLSKLPEVAFRTWSKQLHDYLSLTHSLECFASRATNPRHEAMTWRTKPLSNIRPPRDFVQFCALSPIVLLFMPEANHNREWHPHFWGRSSTGFWATFQTFCSKRHPLPRNSRALLWKVLAWLSICSGAGGLWFAAPAHQGSGVSTVEPGTQGYARTGELSVESPPISSEPNLRAQKTAPKTERTMKKHLFSRSCQSSVSITPPHFRC